jgi:hypothetical protein
MVMEMGKVPGSKKLNTKSVRIHAPVPAFLVIHKWQYYEEFGYGLEARNFLVIRSAYIPDST